jgi:hypothetical protein
MVHIDKVLEVFDGASDELVYEKVKNWSFYDQMQFIRKALEQLRNE